jgi:hypothetical protein
MKLVAEETEVFMADFAEALGASKAASALLVLFMKLPMLRDFLHRMGREAQQGAIGLVIDDEYLELAFPLEQAPKPRQRKGKKRR